MFCPLKIFKAKSYPASERKFKAMTPPPEYNAKDEDIQKNTPESRRGHTMSKLDNNKYIIYSILNINTLRSCGGCCVGCCVDC